MDFECQPAACKMISTGVPVVMAWDADALVLCALNSAPTPLAISTDTIQQQIVDVTGFT